MSLRDDLSKLLGDRLRNLLQSVVFTSPDNHVNEGFGKLAELLAEVVENTAASSRRPIRRLSHVDNPLVGLARGGLLGRYHFCIRLFSQ